ncbi:hypothetical protein AVO45_12520 [Ruegeria marisrubri]|uniref:DUF2946 domain-containing protein n=1 Tax=Ruegeria marisrubri TaxID=1685379 RepID=A0A0X3TK48_9RHOB|nr:hypothetical protein [Ruegeria marisrubri]KUJ76135.1 hypothetical protein AVO45_12520 [Ruegeria marisrubri]
MKTVLRAYLALALAMLVALTGQGLAASRGLNAAVGQMEICTGTGPVVVYMDEQGQPAQPPHYCPDYALTVLGAIAPDQAPVPVAPPRAMPEPSRTAHSLISQPLPATPARAPPLSA